MGKVCSELCRVLNIIHITTTLFTHRVMVIWRGGMVALRVFSRNWGADKSSGTCYTNIVCLHIEPLFMQYLGSHPLSSFMADHYGAPWK